MSCGCGRSPSGECVGWHSLSEEDYQKKLDEYNKSKRRKEGLILFNIVAL